MPAYVPGCTELLRPGGRLLNHAIAWNAGDTTWRPDSFIARYVFPDGELLELGETVSLLEYAGALEVLDVEALRQHYALTLRAWVRHLEQHWDAAVAASSQGRARVWRLYMAASALTFESGDMGVNQVLLQSPGASSRRCAAPPGSDPRGAMLANKAPRGDRSHTGGGRKAGSPRGVNLDSPARSLRRSPRTEDAPA